MRFGSPVLWGRLPARSGNPIPEDRNPDGRMNPLAWAVEADSAAHNTFTKLIRYEGALQREFSRALRELNMLQSERRARQAAAGAAEAPPAATRKTPRRTQSPGAPSSPNGRLTPDQTQNPAPTPLPAAAGSPPERNLAPYTPPTSPRLVSTLPLRHSSNSFCNPRTRAVSACRSACSHFTSTKYLPL